MARLTNEHLHTNIKLVQQDLEYVKTNQDKMQSDLSMIKRQLLDPDHGTIARVNRNTHFRKKANGAIWSVWIAVLGILSKLIFWN